MIEVLLTIILLPFAAISAIATVGVIIGLGRCMKYGVNRKKN